MRQLFQELKRRNVYRVAATYAVVAFVTLQAAELVFPATTLEGVYDVLVVIAFVGFPIALVIAWAFALTPEGVRRTPDAVEMVEPGTGEPVSRGLPGWIVVLGIAALAGGGVWYLAAAGGGASSGATAASVDSVGSETADATRTASHDRPWVAVLPLENLSPEEANAFFAEGIHTEIIGQLSNVSGLGVFGRTTMRQYADTDRTLYEIGEELDARAVLEGSVRRAAGQVRITVQLIDPRSRDHLWTEIYERELSPETVFDIQADIAGQVTSVLETELTASERTRIARTPTADLAAYDSFLKGRNAAMNTWNVLDAGPLEAAIQYLRDAVGRDSTFAEAHAWLGMAYGTRGYFSGEDRWADSAFAAVDRALALEPELPDAYAIRGLQHQTDSPRAAEEAYRRALRLDPNNWLAADGMADLALIEGDYAEAIRWAGRVLRVDPGSEYGLSYMGELLRTIRMAEPAAAWFRRVRGMNPENALSVRGLVLLYLSHGELDRAQETVDSYRSRHPDHPISLRWAAEVALYRDQPEQARQLLERLPEARRRATSPEIGGEQALLGLARMRSGDREGGRAILRAVVDSIGDRPDARPGSSLVTNHVWLARCLATLGEYDEALHHLEMAMEEGEIRHQVFRVDPFFEELRSDSRFQEILGSMAVRQENFREEVLRMEVDLYPPGSETDG